jgi:hypothetical protein
MDFLGTFDQKTISTIFHIFGVALGAGGAYVSDAIFFSSIKDEKISKTEMRFITIGSTFVWVGLALLILSGIGIFLVDTEKYLDSGKFLAKMNIVFVILVNGIVFHSSHLPRIRRHVDHHFPSSDEFMRKKPLLIISGAISFTSWSFALVLGALNKIPFSYSTIMSVYISVILVAILCAIALFKEKSR